MKIVNVMFGCGLGGIEQAFLDYNDALRFAGHDVHAVIHPAARVHPLLEAREVPFHTLANMGAWDPIAIVRLRLLLGKIKPDASIMHGNRGITLFKRAGNAGMLIGVTHNYNTKCAGLKAIFSPTEDLMRYAEKSGMSPAHIFHIPNMVHVDDAPVRAWHEPPVIGAMGRFVSKKGFEIFIETLALLKERGVSFRAVLAGDGEEAVGLKALSVARGLEDTLSFSGWVQDKQAFFDGIDVFCLPSHHEPFGIVLLEAMAQALPVVATRSEGPLEIITDNEDGLLVPVSDAPATAAALAALLSDRMRAEALAQEGYRTVKQHYDLRVASAKLELALHSLSSL